MPIFSTIGFDPSTYTGAYTGSTMTLTGYISLPDGTQLAPALRFTSNPDTGMFYLEIGADHYINFCHDGNNPSFQIAVVGGVYSNGFPESPVKRSSGTGEVWFQMQAFSGSTWGVRLGDPAAKAYIRGTAAQTANILEVQNNGEIAIGGFDASGAVMTAGSAVPALKSLSPWTSGAAANTGTLTNAPAAGNPTCWIQVDDNGTPRYIPAW